MVPLGDLGDPRPETRNHRKTFDDGIPLIANPYTGTPEQYGVMVMGYGLVSESLGGENP
jgi:hypothetical protein